MINLPDLKPEIVSGKRILLRVDVDVPFENGQIIDDTRLKESLETLKYLLDHNAAVFMTGHLGRPEGKDEKLSLKPIANWFLRELQIAQNELQITNIEGFDSFKLSDSLYLLENIRFYKEEEENNSEFAKKLASLADIYVNDAFAVSHREHASVVGVVKLLPHFAGFRLIKEIETLGEVLENPQRPLVVIIGGAKIETKLPLVERMHELADYLLVGGKIAEETNILSGVQHEKIKDRNSVLLVADLNEDETDTTQKSVENFLQFINLAKTIIWNGPIGKIYNSEKDKEGTTAKLAKGIAQSSAFKVVGGGDTLGLLRELNLLDKFSFVSTGGGAMLEFLSGEKLPGIEALMEVSK
ncbi:MAG: phosphoglycerate kinase [Candidatus Levybacteria bacterium]|nr:phosphoglycerate kinase [Candidatus Levybacteria bacterium]